MFKTDLDVRTIPPNLWRLLAVLSWHDVKYGAVDFPLGTVTDLGSTPQLLRRFKAFDPTGPSRRAAVGHDYLYAHGKWPEGRPCDRATADRFLFDALLAEGVSAAVARSWWLGVRIGGWVPWNAYRKAEVDGRASVDPVG